MTYAGKTRQRINVPPHSRISKQLFMRKLAKARFLSGVTATGSALKAVANLKFPHSTDIIVVTDGFSFDSVEKEAEQLSSSWRAHEWEASVDKVIVEADSALWNLRKYLRGGVGGCADFSGRKGKSVEACASSGSF
ncbi:hypothetical protein ANCCEY_12812 [Ancylostoma ceylanicum]|nr:hypothetical protein ANCCEY_12812 [Ancylostoma ceylanicum]